MARKKATEEKTVTVKTSLIPNRLAFKKLIEPSDANFYSVSNEGMETALQVQTGTFLGTKSHPQAKEEEKGESNFQTVQYCQLNADDSILRIKFWVTFLSLNRMSFDFLTKDFWTKFNKELTEYKNTYGFEELAFRYICNIVNARWTFRNKFNTDDMNVTIEILKSKNLKNETIFKYTFDNDFLETNKKALTFFTYDYKSDPNMKVFVDAVTEVFNDNKNVVKFKVSCDLNLQNGAKVYPSELFLTNTSEDDPSKQLYSNEKGAAFSDVKIGNAIRTIDTWYPDFEKNQTPLPINPYAHERMLSIAWRTNANQADFFNLLNTMLKPDCGVSTMTENELHFIFANIIRGCLAGTKN